MSDTMERPDTLSAHFEIGAQIGDLKGRMGAMEERAARIEDKATADTKTVHGRIDAFAAKLDEMSAHINKWMGALALGVFLLTGLIALLAAEISHSGKFF